MPQNKFVDTVSVFTRPAAQTMPVELNSLVQITDSDRPVTTLGNTQDNFKNPLRKILGCILSNLAGLPGPAEPNFSNGVEFRLTIGYLLNSFFGRFWQAKMKKRSKLLNAWLLPIIYYYVSLLILK